MMSRLLFVLYNLSTWLPYRLPSQVVSKLQQITIFFTCIFIVYPPTVKERIKSWQKKRIGRRILGFSQLEVH